MSETADVDRLVHVRVAKTTDIEIHVSEIRTSAGLFVDIREYVTSLRQYGRGITFPWDGDNLDDIIMGLTSLRKDPV